MKKTFFIITVIFLTIIMAGCNFKLKLQPNNTNQQTPAGIITPAPTVSPETTTFTFLVPTEDSLKYCNGADMDSAGFRATITKEITKTLPKTNLSETELINRTIVLASEEANLTSFTSLDQDFIRIDKDIAYIKPVEGWAGVSIFLCAWQPLVEQNITYLTNIDKIVWLQDQQKWSELTK